MAFQDRINFNAPGGRNDITPVFSDPAAFADLIDKMADKVAGLNFDLVAGIDAMGFIMGAALAARLDKGFVAVRKGGKRPVPCDRVEFKDYTGAGKSLELAPGDIPAGAKVLLVDDWIETGAQARAAVELLERQKAGVVGIVAIKIEKTGRELGLGERACFTLL